MNTAFPYDKIMYFHKYVKLQNIFTFHPPLIGEHHPLQR